MAPPSRSKKRDRRGDPGRQGQQAPRSFDAVAPQPYALPLELQQIVLNTFHSAFSITKDPDHLKQVTQEVKGYLFNRDFLAAFSKPSYLQAYALRWSAARALGYSQVLCDPKRRDLLASLPESNLAGSEPKDPEVGPAAHPDDSSIEIKLVCIGGGAGAEIVALAAAHRTLQVSSPLHIIAVDNADWLEPISKLSTAISVPPTLPPHSSESFKTRPENQPMIADSSKVGVTFLHQDVLSWPLDSFQETIRGVSMCTIMFTLNELFTTSLPKTTEFLLQLTDLMCKGSHLLVIDSPGSYSEIILGRVKQQAEEHGGEAKTPAATRKYPMQWLLDHTLLEIAGQNGSKWEKIENEESLWFRIDQGDRERLKYPVELENMRYQLHLYRKQ